MGLLDAMLVVAAVGAALLVCLLIIAAVDRLGRGPRP
jgi:hypothetical protein